MNWQMMFMLLPMPYDCNLYKTTCGFRNAGGSKSHFTDYTLNVIGDTFTIVSLNYFKYTAIRKIFCVKNKKTKGLK